MKRWSNNFISQQKSFLIDYEVPEEHYGQSLVDKSHFIPIAEALKSLGNSAHDIKLNYDFDKGVDDGRDIPLSRKPGHDIAEYSRRVAELQQDAKDSIKKAQELDNAKKAAEARTQELVSSVKGAVSENSQSS